MAYTTIDDPSAYFHTQLYAGTGSELDVTNGANAGDFKPDWIWIKQRNAGSTDHGMFDSSRGVTKNLKTNASDAESSEAQSLKTFNTDGFTLGTSGDYNGSSDTHVAWQWKANNGSRTTFTESGNNPAGGHQANTTAGFSIVDYTGTGALGTIAHGLGVAPTVVFVKGRDDGHSWIVKHSGAGNPVLILNATDAASSGSSEFNNTAPTSSVFTVNTAGGTNQDGEKFIAYCFAPIQGYSKFGSYTGNGNADGSFVYTGFKPAYILVKATDVDEWRIYDHKRANAFNVINVRLKAHTTDAESQDDNECDFLSNGVKWRSSSGGVNTSGQTYIYMAFAESPFVSSKGVPTTAR